jgi:hypothetical protein
LGITGEVGEYEAARLLRLNLCDARQRGHDAELKRNGRIQKFEIKTRLIPRNHNPGQRMSGIKLEGDWHAVLLVILDEEFEPVSIYQASRQRVAKEILRPGSISRNKRGALPVAKFKSIGRRVWPA